MSITVVGTLSNHESWNLIKCGGFGSGDIGAVTGFTHKKVNAGGGVWYWELDY
jgi:hypothetical protein